MRDNIKPKVLIIDKSASSILTLKYIFENQDFELRTTSDTNGVIGLIKEEMPDIILLDITSDTCEDIKLISEIKNVKEISNISIIAISCNSGQCVQKAIDAGTIDFITKPLQFYEVLSKVQSEIFRIYSKNLSKEQID